MATVSAGTDVPLATNMCVIAMEHLPPAIASDAVQIVLSDHHLWGGLRRSQLLAGIAETWGLGLSMHSNSHLGISLAAMTHLAAATPTLTYACDTHYPWKTQDVIRPGVLTFSNGALEVPTTPGLGVELDRDLLGLLHEHTSSAAYGDARTPSTCVPSSRTSRRTRPAGREPAQRRWRAGATIVSTRRYGAGSTRRSVCADAAGRLRRRRAACSDRRGTAGAPLNHGRKPVGGGCSRGARAWRRGRSRRPRPARRPRCCRARAGPARRGRRRSWSTSTRAVCAEA